MTTDGASRRLMATTAAPVELPEQQIDDVRIETQGCVAELRRLAPEAGQLALAAPTAAAGQVVRAIAHYRLTLRKAYHAHNKDKFPESQTYPREFRRLYLGDSPGIQTRDKLVHDLASRLTSASQHPWDRAFAFYTWVWENIQGRIQSYTSVLQALRDRVGDCEERAAVFVALCRASDIPARLVWVPNHNWAEFYLTDDEGQGHWIPAHTAAYSWFGWTGVHELVLQKGDAIRVPESHRPQRLISDWMQWQGAKPKVRYLAELTPLADEKSTASDPGPGAVARKTAESGRPWAITRWINSLANEGSSRGVRGDMGLLPRRYSAGAGVSSISGFNDARIRVLSAKSPERSPCENPLLPSRRVRILAGVAMLGSTGGRSPVASLAGAVGHRGSSARDAAAALGSSNEYCLEGVAAGARAFVAHHLGRSHLLDHGCPSGRGFRTALQQSAWRARQSAGHASAAVCRPLLFAA